MGSVDINLPLWRSGQESACQCGRCGFNLCQKDPLEEEMTTHSSILAWKIPWTEEPGGLQPMGSQRVGHNWPTNIFSTLAYLLWSVHRFCTCIHLVLGSVSIHPLNQALYFQNPLYILFYRVASIFKKSKSDLRFMVQILVPADILITSRIN